MTGCFAMEDITLSVETKCEEICDDEIENDGDGFTDSTDSECGDAMAPVLSEQ